MRRRVMASTSAQAPTPSAPPPPGSGPGTRHSQPELLGELAARVDPPAGAPSEGAPPSDDPRAPPAPDPRPAEATPPAPHTGCSAAPASEQVPKMPHAVDQTAP